METEINALDINRIFTADLPVIQFTLEVILRTVIMYLLAIVILRLMGKRGMGQMTPYEFAIVIALGSALGDSMFYPHIGLIFTATVLLTVALSQQVLSQLIQKSNTIQNFVDSKPALIVENGKYNKEEINKNNLAEDEVKMKLREQGVEYLSEVKKAYLEPSGKVSVFKFEKTKKKADSILP